MDPTKKEQIVAEAIKQAKEVEAARKKRNRERRLARARGEEVEPVKKGRPMTCGPRSKGADVIPGEEYRDRTGRRNPGAISKGELGNSPSRPKPGPYIDKAARALAQHFMMDEGWEITFAIARGEIDATTAQLKALELCANHAHGRPRQQHDITFQSTSTSLSDAIKRMDAMPMTALPNPEQTIRDMALAATMVVEAAIVGEDADDEE